MPLEYFADPDFDAGSTVANSPVVVARAMYAAGNYTPENRRIARAVRLVDGQRYAAARLAHLSRWIERERSLSADAGPYGRIV